MPRTRPLVSVLTPTYNGERFLAGTIESVLGQTWDAIEHVLVDDASSDATGEILRHYERTHSDRIRVVRFRERAGPCRRRNDALDAAGGEFLAWLDHDDLWEPAKTELELEALLSNNDAAFAYSQYDTFDDATGATVESSRHERAEATLEDLYANGCFVASSTVLMRRAALDARGLRFRATHFSFGDDYFLWLALLLDGHALLVDELLAHLRRHPGNESVRLANENHYLWTLELLDEFVETFPEARTRLGRARRRGIARHWVAAAAWERAHGRRGGALAYELRSALADPWFAGTRLAARVRTAPRGVRRRVLSARPRTPAANAASRPSDEDPRPGRSTRSTQDAYAPARSSRRDGA